MTAAMTDATEEALQSAWAIEFRATDAERYALALAAINLSVYDWNLETGVINRPPLGREVKRIWSVPVRTSREWAHAVHPDDRAAFRAALVAHLKGETERLDCEYRYRGEDGAWRWLRQYGIALRRPGGRAHRLVGATADITEGKQRDADLAAARAETERTRAHMQALLDNMRDGVGSAMADGTYLTSNKAMFDKVDIPREKILELGTMQNIWRYQYEQGLVPRIAANAEEHVAEQVELFTRADGSRQVRQRPDGTWVERSFLCMPDNSRLVVVRDITELKHRETELARERDSAEAARAEAVAANQAKSTFLATMSHEIRTPMNGVLGMLEVLEHQEINDGQRAIVSTVRSSASALLRIIDDVLDFSRIEAGRLELEEVPFLLSDLVLGTVDSLQAQATAKGLHLSAQLSAGSADALVGDPLRVRQILFNLIGNALKFTGEGSVHVRATVSPLSDREQRVVLTVTDTGIGISDAERARLFQPFSQADSSTTRRFGGSGLGLSIVRRLVQLMNGDVRVRSQPGKGSAFTVTLRLRAAANESNAAAPSDVPVLETAGGRILVVDDNPVNREVLERQLGLLGLAVDCANDGEQALSLWRPGRYAAVLTDVHMPRLDGYALTAAIRARETKSDAPRTPIVAVTANALRGEEERCLEAGMDAYLSKPVTLARLGTAVGRWIAVTPLAEPSQPAVDRAMLRGWLGDDETELRSVLVKFVDHAREDVRSIEISIARGDLEAMAAAAHKLKGGALSIGAESVQRLATRLEQAGRQGDPTACGDMLSCLRHAIQRVADDIGP